MFVVENKGDTDGQRTIGMTVNGPGPLFQADQVAAVPAKEQRLFTQDWKPLNEGQYKWIVEQMSATLEVKP
jgi:hypothetical protein